MTRYRIRCVVEVPDGMSEDDVYEWVRFELHENGQLDGNNPLVNTELEAMFRTVEIEQLDSNLDPPLNESELELLASNEKVCAVRSYRKRTGFGLERAVEIVNKATR